MKILLPMITLLALLSSCSGADRSMLRQADAIMEEYPDSALTILRTIDRRRVSDGDLPYYALLMTQAQVKTDVPLDSDSLVSIAYREYHDDWLGDKGIRSSFYMGEVFYNQEKPRDAMRHYLSAYEESKRLGNDYWRAKSAERIADLFFNAYNYPEAARYRKEAIKYFGKVNRVTNQRYAIADLATDYINDSKYDEAMSLLDSVYRRAEMENGTDSFLLEYIRSPRIDVLIATDRKNELDSADLSLLDIKHRDISNIEAAILRSQLCTNDEVREMTDILDSIDLSGTSDEDHVRLLYARYHLAKASDDKAMALSLVDSLLYYQNTMTENIIKESVTSAERDFYSDMSVRNRKKADLYFIGFLAACLIAILFWRIYRLSIVANRAKIEAGVEAFIELKAYSDKVAKEKSSLEETLMKKNHSIKELVETIAEETRKGELLKQEINEIGIAKKQLESNIQEKSNMVDGLSQSLIEKTMHIDLLQQRIEARSNELRSKDAVLETLFREKWTTLNMLCNEYYEKGDSPSTRRHIIDSLEKELKKIGSKKGLAQIEAAVDERFDGIIGLLKDQCPNLSEKDITMTMLIIAGFSGKAVSYLMGIKTGNYYVSKRRLIDRIAASDAPDRNRFIAILT